jgi:hypothetical protein
MYHGYKLLDIIKKKLIYATEHFIRCDMWKSVEEKTLRIGTWTSELF